ncbi:hypothetical protein [Dysgonomonas sp. HGC4]|uniref:hypothetical protein n=1 Tax=Dysgonomonas sp. HGC4 TaxID=1658009 RepID=UPI00067FD406|nr:hypothetical protein [Dysgonomonas sp. HGC4]MBD8348964.1 hypothetical protein [Dysgonomonas sp. HGC4]
MQKEISSNENIKEVIDKNDLLNLFSTSMGNSEYKLIEYCESNDFKNYSTIIEEFEAIQNDIYDYIFKLTEPNIQLSGVEIEEISFQYCTQKYSWVNEVGVKAINRWLVWMCWHEGIFKN